MKITPLTAMLTLVTVLASSVAVAGCGGKSGGASVKPATNTTPTITTTTKKHKTKPSY
jgi:hypothetical protein